MFSSIARGNKTNVRPRTRGLLVRAILDEYSTNGRERIKHRAGRPLHRRANAKLFAVVAREKESSIYRFDFFSVSWRTAIK